MNSSRLFSCQIVLQSIGQQVDDLVQEMMQTEGPLQSPTTIQMGLASFYSSLSIKLHWIHRIFTLLTMQ